MFRYLFSVSIKINYMEQYRLHREGKLYLQ